MRDLKLLQICFASKMLPFREGIHIRICFVAMCHASKRVSSARCFFFDSPLLEKHQGCFPPNCTDAILNPPQAWFLDDMCCNGIA